MAKLERLAAHFNQYWDTKKVKKSSIIDNSIDNDIKLTAAEVPAMKDAPAASSNKEEQSPVLNSVEDLGGTVENEVEKKMNLQVRRVIEDAVRRYLGPMFQELEKAIKPQVDKEVSEQSAEVKQDIKQVVPAISKVEDTAAPVPAAPAASEKAPKELPKAPKMPPAAPEVPLKEAASLIKRATQARIEVISPNINIGEFEEAFVAFIFNSLDAVSKEGKLIIRTNYVKEDKIVKIIFSDTGSGISRDNLKRLGEPFFSTKGRGEGVGLGLATAYGIIARHNGKIDVESTVGRGATFTINLPIVQPEQNGNPA